MANKYARGIGEWADDLWWTAESGGSLTTAPVDGDVAYIPLTATINLNSLLASTVDLGGLVVNGTLNCCTTAKASLKVSADITGSGTINCGGYTTGAIDPSKTLATNLYMVFNFNGAYGFNSVNLALNFYCWNPTTARQFVVTSGAEALGQTELGCADMRADWGAFETAYFAASGAHTQVHVVDIAGTLPDCELRTVASINETNITLDAGTPLVANKAAASQIVLLTRNIRVIGNTGTAGAVRLCKAASVLGCEIACISTSYGVATTTACTLNGSIWGGSRGISGGTGHVNNGNISGNSSGISGGTGHVNNGNISGNGNGIYLGTGHVNNSTISGNGTGISYGVGHVNNGTVSGNTYGISGGTGHVNNGNISGNTYGINGGNGHVNNGTVSGNTYGISSGTGHVNNGTVSGNGTGINASMVYNYNAILNNTTDVSSSDVKCFNTQMLGATKNSGYLTLPSTYSSSKNHDGVAGGFKAWSGGGKITTSTVIYPTGFDRSYFHECEATAYACIRQDEYQIDAGKMLKVRGWFKLVAAFTIAPKLEILDLAGSSLGAGTSDEVASLTDTTNWQQVDVEYTNTAAYPITVIIRASAQHASSDLYETYQILSQDLPDVGNVVAPDTVAGVTGTYDEVTRNTDPGVANVLKDVTYKILNVSKVGTLDLSNYALKATTPAEGVDIPTYLLLSVAQHFKTLVTDFDIFVEGSRKVASGNWGELRVDGPNLEECTKSSFKVPFKVSVLLSTVKDEKDIIAQEKNLAKLLEGFTKHIQIYKYGDDGTLLGCARITSGINITKYGNIDPSLNILQCVIEAKYEFQFGDN